ncbi:MAG TPA: hypothetical protein VEQ58_18255, partial [Polyangiaceae bacterium]|nr:hypothetical protein [Polyangiaceae bacterium]
APAQASPAAGAGQLGVRRQIMAVSAEQRAATLRLTVGAMGLVLGLSAAAVLPLLLPWSGQLLLTALALGVALLPFVVVTVARRLARAEPLRLLPVALGVAGAAGLALVPLFSLYRAQLRVLNHGEEPVALLVDGRRVARVEPSSGESALAGVELTVPAGEHDFRVVSERDGSERFRAREHVEGGRPHLFAPDSAGYCFSIERRGYGDAGSELQTEALDGSNPFWVLPDGISWFSPNPEPGPVQTSGGTLSCLRQRRCAN